MCHSKQNQRKGYIFDNPDDAWASALTRPTVNLFLFDIARAARPPIPIPPRRDPGGVLLQERPAPCVSFSFLLSVWGQDIQEENRLLGDAVRAVLSTPPRDSARPARTSASRCR